MNSPVKKIRVGCPAHNCGGRCLLIAHVQDGRIIRLDTDDRPDTIASPQLRACARGRAYLRRQYHPDRLLHPHKRVGARGEGNFVRIGWDEALSTIVSQMVRIKLQYGNDALFVPYGTGSYSQTNGRQACPLGAHVVSGGFGLDPEYKGTAAPRMELSYPDPNGWNVRAVNGAAGPAADARAYAVCLGAKEGVDVRNFQTIYFVDKDVLVKADNGEARQSIDCGGESAYVLAGGSRTIKGRSANVEMQESFPDTPGSWTVAVTNRGDKKAGDATVKLYAVCIKK